MPRCLFHETKKAVMSGINVTNGMSGPKSVIIFLFIALNTPVLNCYSVEPKKYAFYPQKMVLNADFEAYFQFAPFNFAGVSVVKCQSSIKDELLWLLIDNCDSNLYLDTLMQRTGSYKGLWFRFDYGATTIHSNYLNRLFKRKGPTDMYGFRVARGPGGGDLLITYPSDFILCDDINILAFMFNELPAEKENVAGYTKDQFDHMSKAIKEQTPFQNKAGVVLDLFYLSRTDPDLLLNSFNNDDIFLYQMDGQLKPNLAAIKPFLAKKNATRIRFFLDNDVTVALQSSAPHIRWDAWLFKGVMPFENSDAFVKAFRGNRRLMEVPVLVCANDLLTLAPFCDSVPIQFDYAVQLIDHNTILLFKFSAYEPLKTISFAEHTTGPFILAEVARGPNAPTDAKLVSLEELNLKGNIRFVFGFAEQKGAVGVYLPEQVTAFAEVLKKLPTGVNYSVRLRVDFLTETTTIMDVASKAVGCSSVFLYSRSDTRITELQLAHLKENVNLLGNKETFLIVDDVLKSQMYADTYYTLPPPPTPLTTPSTPAVHTLNPSNLTFATVGESKGAMFIAVNMIVISSAILFQLLI